MKFKVTIEVELLSGPEQDEETLIDYFAGTIGRDNGAKQPLWLQIGDGTGEVASTYVVKEVDA